MLVVMVAHDVLVRQRTKQDKRLVGADTKPSTRSLDEHMIMSPDTASLVDLLDFDLEVVKGRVVGVNLRFDVGQERRFRIL